VENDSDSVFAELDEKTQHAVAVVKLQMRSNLLQGLHLHDVDSEAKATPAFSICDCLTSVQAMVPSQLRWPTLSRNG
jgi:hypothetical protein